MGNVAGSLSVVAIYAVGGFAAAVYNGWTDIIPWDLVPWFLVFQVLAVLLFSSIFMAVGAAVTQLKEAQSMLLPVWLLMCMPMFVWLQIVREPNGPLAVGFSLFPPSAPLVMVLRLASEEVVPAWQLALSLVVLVATTVGDHLPRRPRVPHRHAVAGQDAEADASWRGGVTRLNRATFPEVGTLRDVGRVLHGQDTPFSTGAVAWV